MLEDLSNAGLDDLMAAASAIRDRMHGPRISYSRKVFLPVTHLCRDVCRYCTFARPPRRGQTAYMTEVEVLESARKAAALGCREALFTLGDQPEVRWRDARVALHEMGFPTTLAYVAHLARRVHEETGLLPHINPGVMSDDDITALRPVSASMGLMLESASDRLMARGGPHFGCPDKAPTVRLATLAAAGRARVPFTTGLLIGIGETFGERLDALQQVEALHSRYGHIQEVIIQPFRAKPGTAMAKAPEPPIEDLLRTIAAARLMLPAEVSVQAPPNLAPEDLRRLIDAGINDLGGISPLTPDFVNPEAPWPHLDALAGRLQAMGRTLTERLTIYPRYARSAADWTAPSMTPSVLRAVDGEGWPREDDWLTGVSPEPPMWISGPSSTRTPVARGGVHDIVTRAARGKRLSESDIAALFAARGDDFHAVCAAADRVRADVAGDRVSYVITRNINYTNVCTYSCRFCAFSKGKVADDLRGAPYEVELAEIGRRAAEAWARGATEVCLQGGIHPGFTGETYLEILNAVRAAAPGIHVHAFSPLEVLHGATSLGLPVQEYLRTLKAAGLGSLPGTAAEILDDEVRHIICPDKLTTDQWLSVMRDAHEVGLRSTATIMFGHVDGYQHWARHLLRLRDLQVETSGFTEFVPLPFVAAEAPIFRKGASRIGPTFREAVIMHAVARLALHPAFANIQTSWVKMGVAGAGYCLAAGANDIGGTLMNETITRSAGARHGQEATADRLESVILAANRTPRLRTTLYGDASQERRATALAAPELSPSRETPFRRGQVLGRPAPRERAVVS